MWSKSKPDVEFQYGGRLGEFNGMSSQSHVSHCRVLPLGEFTVTIPKPHVTLQGAVIWLNQCHNRATLQGVRIPSAILKLVFRHIGPPSAEKNDVMSIFVVLMQFRLWRAAAFVSSLIHLLQSINYDVAMFVTVCRWVQTKKNDFTFWMIFGLSPNLGLSESLSERLIQKVKWPNVCRSLNSVLEVCFLSSWFRRSVRHNDNCVLRQLYAIYGKYRWYIVQ